MFLSVILALMTIITSSLCNVDPLLIDYYTKLITKKSSEARSYRQRKDNSDFFRNISDNTVHNYGTFDFIIVGAGSSGSVVANRLSEVKQWKILLLEAGGEVEDFDNIPSLGEFAMYSDRNWGYTSTLQPRACFGYENRRCILQRGKLLGGTGSVNGIYYIRGNARDYDSWEELGNSGWSYRDILRYFKRLENSQIPNGDEGYHGFAGPINSAYVIDSREFNDIFEDGFQQSGFDKLDYNGAQQIGTSTLQFNIQFGRRVSGETAFVNPARNRMNFNVTLQAYVTKILIDQASTARGVLFVKNGIKYKAIASNEVIISAGAINTPQLLMLSGIGPKEELRKHNIELILDSPVGEASRDHVGIRNLAFKTNITVTTTLRELVKKYLEGRGPLTGGPGPFSIGLMNLDHRNNSLPDVEYLMVPPIGDIKELVPPPSYTDDIQRSLSSSINVASDFFIATLLLNPKSSGKISLKSANPMDFPNIDVRLFSVEDDLDRLYRAVQFAVNLSKTEAFRKVNATPHLTLEPCKMFTFNSRKFWYCAFRYLALSYYHISSTARMGPPTDPLAVVNHELKVYGIRNLRIVDCSILPNVVAGHTNSIAFVVGDKAADMIKSEYGTLH